MCVCVACTVYENEIGGVMVTSASGDALVLWPLSNSPFQNGVVVKCHDGKRTVATV